MRHQFSGFGDDATTTTTTDAITATLQTAISQDVAANAQPPTPAAADLAAVWQRGVATELSATVSSLSVKGYAATAQAISARLAQVAPAPPLNVMSMLGTPLGIAVAVIGGYLILRGITK